ncbi:MBL fold metallo-hydrolase [Bacillus sp. PS06]|uniref:MBL fold metallo-hydrolase n=1 Tax=Bacillus sp. PS06 TaxID=2764176 RepID=UPI00177E13CE|nr:MBL fold metallo-hydrolase [Bacillus sp. PS06]MBD8069617.1 hypothetical protein [Bacillus sp. PS06]
MFLKILFLYHIIAVYGPHDKQVDEVPYSTFISYTEDSEFNLGPFHISFLRNVHPVEAYSIKITCEGKEVVYTADTSFTEELVQFAKDCDLLITECSLYTGMDGTKSGHMTAEEAGILAKNSNAKQVLLTHLPHYGNLQDLLNSAKEQGNENIRLAEKAMLIDI